MADGGRTDRDDARGGSSEPMPPELVARLEDLRNLVRAECTHYQLLGLPRSADRKAIKRSYYELAALVHPDRHGARDLGAWKPLMEALFRHVTLAHDTLGDSETRRIYDLLLPPETDAERSVSPPPTSSRPAGRSVSPPSTSSWPAGRSVSPPPSSRPAVRISSPAPRIPTPAPRISTPAPRVVTPPPYVSAAAPERGVVATDRTAAEIARRDALARRLLAGRSSHRRQESAAASPGSAPATEAPIPIVEAPDVTAALRAEAEAAEFRGEFTKATRSWRRLAVLDPKNPDVAQRTARSLLGSKDANLHEAAELAKRAIAAVPNDHKNHLLLAEIYLEAQLPTAARSVLEHALSLGIGATEVNALLIKVEAVLGITRK